MKTILLKAPIALAEYQDLCREFPKARFKYLDLGDALPLLQKDEKNSVDALYCDEWDPAFEELENLRWIHFSTLEPFGLSESVIETLGYPLVTITRFLETQPLVEYITGAVLAFIKNLFFYHKNFDRRQAPPSTLQGKKALLIAPGKVGEALAQTLRSFGMTIWEVQEQRAFHPYCDETFSFSELHALLPAVDLVYRNQDDLSTPSAPTIDLVELKLIKPEGLLILLDRHGTLNFKALADVITQKSLGGLLIDTSAKISEHLLEIFLQAPNALVTPGIAHLPSSHEHFSYRAFRYNLRFFLQGQFNKMKNLVSVTTPNRSERRHLPRFPMAQHLEP